MLECVETRDGGKAREDTCKWDEVDVATMGSGARHVRGDDVRERVVAFGERVVVVGDGGNCRRQPVRWSHVAQVGSTLGEMMAS